MKILNKMMKFTALLLVLLMQFFFIPPTKTVAVTTKVDLGTADSFAVLAGEAVTNVPTSVITGNLGLSPAAGSFYDSGVTQAQVTGTIYSVNTAGPAGYVENAALLTTAKNDLATAYTNAKNRTPNTTYATTDNQLGGKTLTAGVYAFGHGDTANLTAASPLTLDAEGDANAVFIFQASSDLVTASDSVVKLTNGAQACNVFWQVTSSATLGSNSTFIGTILALTSATLTTGANVQGRVLVRNGAVTLQSNTIAKSTCTTTTSSSSSSSGGSASAPAAKVCPNLNCVTPLVIESRRVDADSIYISWGPYAGISTFIVQYGLENGKWLYNTKVTGFSTTINALPPNQPIWVLIEPTDDCSIGPCGVAKLVGGPLLPNTGFDPRENNNIPWYIPAGIFLGISGLLVLIQKNTRFSSKN